MSDNIYNDNAPVYIQIADILRDEIIQGRYDENNMLPPELKLSEKFGVSRTTIRKSINLLIEEDLVERKQGSGTYIKEKKISHNIFPLQSFKEEMRQLNRSYKNKILEFKIIGADKKIASLLDIEVDDQIYFVKRLKFIDGLPSVIEDSYMPLSLFPDMSYNDYIDSKYEYVEAKKGFKIIGSKQELIPILGSEEVAELLNINKSKPLLKLKSLSYLSNEVVFEYTEVIFNTDNYKFVMNTVKA